MSATIVSLLPMMVKERKVGVFPPEFEIPAAKDGIPGVLVIKEPAKTSTYIDHDRQSLSIKILPEDMAQSVVFDYVVAQVVYRDDAKPGLFWVPGSLTGKQVLEQYGELITHYKALQLKWFQTLVEQADMDFAKYQSTRAIGDLHKIAARELGYESRWMEADRSEQMVKCPACRTMISSLATICPQCRTATSASSAPKK